MRAYLLNAWDAARTSYWFVPSLFAGGAVGLSVAMPLVDSAIADADVALPQWVQTTTDTARASLSAMSGAVIAVTGTVFSITVVTLSLASQQFGPRLLRRFMYDMTTQLTLGTFLATGLYCLLALRSVERPDATPHLSILVAAILAVLSMAILIAFIHHIALLIQAPHVVAAVARDLDDAIQRLFPEEIGDPPQQADLSSGEAVRSGNSTFVVRSTQEGYVQAADGERLVHYARNHDLVVTFLVRPGDFVCRDAHLADVHCPAPDSRAALAPQEIGDAVNGMVIVGDRRTPRQDVECAIDELVEVAVRSLSPGINDPFTAINCIDRLGAALGRLAERRLPSSLRYDRDGALRVVARPLTFHDALAAAFNQIRQYGRDSVAVTIRQLEALASIAQHLRRDHDREAVRHHARMIARSSESYKESHDREAVRQRLERVIALLGAHRVPAS